MSNYNILERTIARALHRFPNSKKIVKILYSRLVYIKARKKFKYKAIANPVDYKIGQYSSFFGYYDKSPENSKGFVLAYVSAQSTKNLPSAQQSVELAVFDESQNPLFRLPISAYNWQQGGRAHWLTEDLFIFNDFDPVKKSYVALVYSLASKKKIKLFDHPVQDSFQDIYFISLNYQRLMFLRPDYGYRNLPVQNVEQLGDLHEDGLWCVDYETGEARLLISLSDACNIKPLAEFKNSMHKFNHVMISPDGKRFIFMHRYFLGQRRFDRLLLADVSSGKMSLLNDYGMVSHCFWADQNTILGYMRGPGDKDGYWLIDLETGEFHSLLHNKLDIYGDGHPHVLGDWFITDTYPDKARMQHLLLCNWKSGEVKTLGEFFHGFEYVGEARCDLHPRFSPDGKAVFFDSVFTGQRQLYRMELPE